MRRAVCEALTIGLAIAGPGFARAQSAIELTPRAGVFGHTGRLLTAVEYVPGCDGLNTVGYGQRTDLAFGGSLSAWIHERWGLDFSTSYAKSQLTSQLLDECVGETPPRIAFARFPASAATSMSARSGRSVSAAVMLIDSLRMTC